MFYEKLDKEELEDCEQDKKDNYIPRPMSDYTGDLEDDRYWHHRRSQNYNYKIK